MHTSGKNYPDFIHALMDHPLASGEVIDQIIETHISWVLLSEHLVYKIKKPVDFGFLNFSTLELRQYYCAEEVRLNRRTAPGMYLSVVAIVESEEGPQIVEVADNDSTPHPNKIIEYAVKMLRFPDQMQLDRMLQRDALTLDMIEAFAGMLANFHQSVNIAATNQDDFHYGDPDHVIQPVIENFTQINSCLKDKAHQQQFANLQAWSEQQGQKLYSFFTRRKQDGFIRECHGDLHLRNLAWINQKPVAFDCIEFNPDLRWVDVISDIAFLVMDLEDHSQANAAHNFLNHYLEQTGDYAGLRGLTYYLVYRCMVRAKVAAIRLSQPGMQATDAAHTMHELDNYLHLAETFIQARSTPLIITRGFSASGKSTVSSVLLERLNAIRIRSDVERKRLHGIDRLQSAQSEVNQGLYSKDSSQRTYERLRSLAKSSIESGYPVIVDAAFLKFKQRDMFRVLARELGVAFIIIECVAPEETLKTRIQARVGDVSDADLSVLEHQLLNDQALSAQELKQSLVVNTDQLIDYDEIVSCIGKYNK